MHPPVALAAADHPGSAGRVWLMGFAMAAIGLCFAFRYPLAGNTNRLVDIGKMANYGRVEFAGFVGGALMLFALYLLGLRETRRLTAGEATRAVFWTGGLTAAFFAAMYPVNAIDIFIYSVRSRLLTAYGEDPIAVLPLEHPSDPWIRFASEWASTHSPYGPLWNQIAAPGTAIAGDRIGIALAAYKILAAVSVLLGAWLIGAIVAESRPEWRAGAALLYLWNPLVLWEGIGNGHNDVVMLVPILGALLAWQRRRDDAIVPLLIVAVLIKYIALLLIPVAIVAILRRSEGLRSMAGVCLRAIGMTTLLVALSLYPFYDLGAIRESVREQSGFMLTSPAAALVPFLTDHTNAVEPLDSVRFAALVLFAALFVIQIYFTWRRPDRLPRAMFEITFAYLLVAAFTYRNWYAIWLVALVAVLPLGWATARALVWSGTSLFVYGFLIWGWHWWRIDYTQMIYVVVPFIFLPPLLVSLCELIVTVTNRRNRRDDASSRHPAPHLRQEAMKSS